MKAILRFIVSLALVVAVPLLAACSQPPAAQSGAAGGAPQAQGGFGGPGGGQRGPRFGQLLLGLNLTDDQKSQIRGIMADNRKANEAITDPQQRRANTRTAFEKIRALLTPDQRAKLAAEVKAGREKHAGSTAASS